MVRWEYTFKSEATLRQYNSDSTVMDTLNRMGSEGWELFHMVDSHETSYRPIRYFWFKRQIDTEKIDPPLTHRYPEDT